MGDDFRRSKAKLEELVISTVSSFKRLSDQAKSIAENLRAAQMTSRSEHAKFAGDLDDLEPKIFAAEQQIGQLRTLMSDTPAGSGSAELAKTLTKIPKTVARLEDTVLPAGIAKSRAHFDAAISDMRKEYPEQITGLSAGLKNIWESHEEMEQRRGEVEASLATVMTKTFEIERNVALLSEDTRNRLSSLEQTIKSRLPLLKTRIADLAEERRSRAKELSGQVAGDLASLAQQIGRSAKALRHQVRSKAQENEEAQVENMEKITGLRDQIDGPENVAGRVQDAEERLKELAAGLEVTMGRWVSPTVVAARLQRIEDQLLEYETKLNERDSKGVGRAAKFAPVVEVISDPPPETPRVAVSPPPGH
jgi:hypothetical protein